MSCFVPCSRQTFAVLDEQRLVCTSPTNAASQFIRWSSNICRVIRIVSGGRPYVRATFRPRVAIRRQRSAGIRRRGADVIGRSARHPGHQNVRRRWGTHKRGGSSRGGGGPAGGGGLQQLPGVGQERRDRGGRQGSPASSAGAPAWAPIYDYKRTTVCELRCTCSCHRKPFERK